MSSPLPIRTLETPATDLIAICGKCSRKLDGGFGEDGDTSLSKALRSALRSGKGKRAKVRIVETKCLDICPKHAVVVTSGRTPGELLMVRQHTPVRAIVESLGLTPHVQPA